MTSTARPGAMGALLLPTMNVAGQKDFSCAYDGLTRLLPALILEALWQAAYVDDPGMILL